MAIKLLSLKVETNRSFRFKTIIPILDFKHSFIKSTTPMIFPTVLWISMHRIYCDIILPNVLTRIPI